MLLLLAIGRMMMMAVRLCCGGCGSHNSVGGSGGRCWFWGEKVHCVGIRSNGKLLLLQMMDRSLSVDDDGGCRRMGESSRLSNPRCREEQLFVVHVSDGSS